MTSPYDENWNLDIAGSPWWTIANDPLADTVTFVYKPLPRSIEGDATHEWRNDLGSWVTCGKCGVVRRADRMHRPCTGHPPVISPRAHRCNGGRA
jgi:hypothetical protein